MQLERLAAVGLLACCPTFGQDAGSLDGPGREHSIPLFMAQGNAEGRQGFIRIINHSDAPGMVEIVGIDDAGEHHGPVELEIGDRQTVHLNSEDLENGNTGKGLSGALGAGEGNWRLLLYGGALDIEPLAYIRTPIDGFLTSVHDIVPAASLRHRVPIFNPGRNTNQQSSLRLINRGDVEARVTITGRDDAGENGEADEPPGEFSLTIPPNSAQLVESADLEMGNMESYGIGVGTGKWSLDVYSDVPIGVVNLMSTPTNHLSNLSTAYPGYRGAVGLWQVSLEDEEDSEGFIMLLPDSRMYAWLPETPGVVRIARATFETAQDGISGSGELFESGKVEVGPGLNVSGGSEDFEFSAEYRSGDWIRGQYNVVGEPGRSFHGWAFTGFERGGDARSVAGLWSPMLASDADLSGDFEAAIDGALDFSLTVGGVTCTAAGSVGPVNPRFSVFEADIGIDCTLLQIPSADIDLILTVLDAPNMPGSGTRAVVLAIVHDDKKIALGALFDLQRP